MDSQTMVRDAKRALRSIMPQPLLNWREEQFYGRYGEIELHLVEFLCRRDQDAIDVGANDGCYIYFLRRHVKQIYAFEPLPWLARDLERKFRHDVIIKELALSRSAGTTVLRVPLVDGAAITGCSTISPRAPSVYSEYREIPVRMEKLDEVYDGEAGFIKIDVEGHEEAVLEGARETIRRCRPRLLVESIETFAPGGLRRITEFLRTLGFNGFFVNRRGLLPVEEFDVAKYQRPEDAPDLRGMLEDRERFPRYIYNFIFMPAEEPRSTFDALETRIAELA
jgi:FkbM family methyltransferase